MNLTKSVFKNAFCSLAISLLTCAGVNAADIDKQTVFAKGADINATAPDSLTLAGDTLWASFANGADSTGAGGNSTVVQYAMDGKVLKTYSIPGNVDGLKFDSGTGLIWALQNQDGNSTLVLIDPVRGITKRSPLSYGTQSSTRGYDDVVFQDGHIYLSYTNPVGAGDDVIQMLDNRKSPLLVSSLLKDGVDGTDLANEQHVAPIPVSDPDSLKTTPTGGLMLTSGSDGALTFVDSIGTRYQSVSFLQLVDSKGVAVTGLDDAVWTVTPKGTFFVADTAANQILKVEVSHLTPVSLFASVAGLKAVGSVNLETGLVTPFIGSLQSPHGLVFVPNFKSIF
jgi:hypothetical protein